PGFDVTGIALSKFLTLHIRVTQNYTSTAPVNCTLSYEGEGDGSDEIDLDPERNLITRVSLYVLRCHDQHHFPAHTFVHVKNDIPLGRGLGSSGAAVVAGCVLANEVGRLALSKDRMLDFCLMIERHPDNVAAALNGGFVGTYLNDLNPEDMARKEIPLSEVLPAPAGGIDTGLKPPVPPLDIGRYIRFPWSKEIKAVAIIPDFEVSTAKARDVLPEKYSRADVVFNMQRVAILTHALGQSPPNAQTIYSAMQDKIHQPYRRALIPGLTEILGSLTPASHPGLLGICLSGAGPTILALATDRFDIIAHAIIKKFKDTGISCKYSLLELVQQGASVATVPDP
ncbi:MAG: hypothetical protein Q9214_002229, partial [Letrouitia sp. 1 TL-2023]